MAAAARDYSAALRVDNANAGARNNFAMTLLELGCPVRAREQLQQIDTAALSKTFREAVLDTAQRVDTAAEALAGGDPPRCQTLPD